MSDREAKEAREVEQGYQEQSLREVKLRDWWSGRDDPRRDREFKALAHSLSNSRWQRRVRAERGESYERLLVRARVHRARTRARRKMRRRALAVTRAPVITCCCGARFCNVPLLPGARQRWCSLACQKRGLKRRARCKPGAVLSCKVCGVEFCRAPWVGGHMNHCSDACLKAGRRAYQRRYDELHPDHAQSERGR